MCLAEKFHRKDKKRSNDFRVMPSGQRSVVEMLACSKNMSCFVMHSTLKIAAHCAKTSVQKVLTRNWRVHQLVLWFAYGIFKVL